MFDFILISQSISIKEVLADKEIWKRAPFMDRGLTKMKTYI